MNVEILCLGILSRSDATGYEIRKQVTEGPFSHFYKAGFGSIYPALRKLTERGLIRCTPQPQEKRPDKKVYSIAGAGRRALADALGRAPGPDAVRSDFLFLTFFGDTAPAAVVRAALDDRIAWLRAKVETMRGHRDNCALSAGEAFTLGYGLAVYEAILAYLETHKDDLAAPGPAPASPSQPRAAE